MKVRLLAIAIATVLSLGSAAAEVVCDRVVAIGDLHGGYDEFITILQETDLIGEDLRWSGGNDCLVQEGDIVDRGDRSRSILDYLMELKPQAPERIFVLLGNHEFLNMTGETRYASQDEIAAFAGDETEAERAAWFDIFQVSESAMGLETQEVQKLFDEKYPRGWFARRRAFSPEGRYGSWLLQQPTIVMIDGTVYVHGGLAPVDAFVGIEHVNESVHREILEQHVLRADLERAGWIYPLASFNEALWAVDARFRLEGERRNRSDEDVELLEKAERYLALARGFGMRQDGPLWHRSYADGDEQVFEKQLTAALAALGAERMVVAHTNTDDRRIQNRFDGRVFLVNTGAGPAYEGEVSALVISWTGSVRAVYPGSEVPLAEASFSDEEIERFLLNGEVIESEEIGVGISRPKKLLLKLRGETMKAAFKTIDMELTGKLKIRGEQYRPGFTDRAIYERAAYLLDRHLGLNMVPVAVMRKIGKEEGSVVHWVSDAVSELDRREKKLEPPDPVLLGRQKQIMRAFDALIYNEDRNLGNMLITTEDWKLHLIDHSRSFRLGKLPPENFMNRPTSMTRGFYEKLKALNKDDMYALLEDVVHKSRIRAMMSRRDRLVKKIEEDIEVHGEESVFWDVLGGSVEE
jgi:hypothetical protein